MYIRQHLAINGGPRAVTAALPRAWPQYEPQAIHEVVRLMRNGRTFDYKYGPELASFEQDFASFHRLRYALMVNSGTSALHSAYYGLGIRSGDEVICPALTFVGSVTPLLLLGAIPVFCDVDRFTGNIDPAQLASLVSNRTKAVSITHLWGRPCQMDVIVRLCRRHGLALIEDCSHAHGSYYAGKLVGTFGDVAAFSLGTSKMISGGMAGVLITRHREVFERACLLGHFQQRSEISVRSANNRLLCYSGLGANLRASPIAAVLAHSHLRTLRERIRIKHANLRRLAKGFGSIAPIVLPPILDGYAMGAWFGFKLEYDDDEMSGISKYQFLEALKAEGVEVEDYGYRPLHELPQFRLPRRHNKPSRDRCPNATAISLSGFGLPTRRFHGSCEGYTTQCLEAFEKVWACRKEIPARRVQKRR